MSDQGKVVAGRAGRERGRPATSGGPVPDLEPPRPERVRSGGKTGLSLLVAGVLAFIGVAIVKPWSTPTPPTAVPRVTQSPNSLPTTSQPPEPVPTPVSFREIDWAAVGAALQPHDRWGVRFLVLGNVLSDPPMPMAGQLTEFWVPLTTPNENSNGAIDDADASVFFPPIGRIAAIGVTTPLDRVPLDVRAWDNRPEGWLAIPVNGLTPSADPTARMLTVPQGWSVDGAWPPGAYRVDMLLEHGVKHVDVHLAGEREPLPLVAGPRSPSQAQLEAMSGTPGGFIASGMENLSYLFAGLPPVDVKHGEAEAWLALSADQVFWAPGPWDPHPAALNAASLLGAALGGDDTFVTSRLTRIAPVEEDLDRGTLIEAPAGSRRQTVAVFRAPNQALGFPASAYRIDAIVDTGRGYVSRSWDVPMLPRPNGTASPLLAAVRRWSQVDTDRWNVLAPGHHVAVFPSSADTLPENPDASCHGGADVGITPWYIRVTGLQEPADGVAVRRLDGVQRGATVRVEYTQVLHGVVALRPLGADWSAGNYAVVLRRGSTSETVIVCVH